jgi:hypothetical protein
MKWMEGKMRKVLGMLVVNMRQDGNCEETQAGKGNKNGGGRKVKLNKG